MTTHRSVLRDAVVRAIDASEWGYGVEHVPSFVQALDEDRFPVFGAGVLGETAAYFDKDQYERTIRLQVAWKRRGSDDLEAMLDEDAAAIEAIVLPILFAAALDAIPQETQFDISSADGGQRHGTGLVIFACTVLTDIPV